MSEIASLRHSRVTTATRHGFIHNLGGQEPAGNGRWRVSENQVRASNAGAE
ncbi:MAG: hypothetical protein U0836_24035 [Pirellulales bacterium]